MQIKVCAAAFALPLAACCSNPPDLRANWYFVSDPATAAGGASAPAEQPPPPRTGYEDLRMKSRLKLAILNHDRQPVMLQSVLLNPSAEKSAGKNDARTWRANPAFTLAPGEMWVLDVSPPETAATGRASPVAASTPSPWLARCQIPVFVRVVACRAEREGIAQCPAERSTSELTVPGAMPSALPDGWESCQGTPTSDPR